MLLIQLWLKNSSVIITVDGLDNEFGFITDKMTEEAFDKAAANVDMISRIRIDDTKLQ
jgi:homoserine dehydrogenase